MSILVTGGLGFIGSHTVVELMKNKYEVIVADNLINASIEVLENIKKIIGIKPKFYEIDVTDEQKTKKIFQDNKIEAVIHFAGLKAVGESVEKPLEYYYNNVLSTIVLSKLCIQYNVNKFVFSSSATVYGNQKSPFKEDMELKKTTNPYGETKVISERILSDLSSANKDFGVVLLRYFNPIGAHKSGLIGENPNGIPNNLLPYVTKVASGKLECLSVYGDDYDTVDGTGVRDYIHVVDLAKGHIKALEHIKKGTNIYNLGTGNGTSVLQIINTFEKVNSIKVPYKIVPRRAGDIDSYYADVSKAKNEIGWVAQLSIEDMLRDSWNFERKMDIK